MTANSTSIRVIDDITPGEIPFDTLFASQEPVIMRGLMSHWPLVKAGLGGMDQAMEFMGANYSGQPINVYIGEPAIGGRFAYNADCSGLNYRTQRMDLRQVFDKIRQEAGEDEHTYYYINSLIYERGFPALQQDNNLQLESKGAGEPLRTSRIWIGTESRASAHWDIPDNIACCAVGNRRFTLFPPEQVANLYPGPLHLTPGGQAVTMVDLKNPDFDAFPRAKEALSNAVTADLAPGDALYYPRMWWHEVEALDRFNVMVNYWWTDSPKFMGNPMDVLMHAILNVRGRPDSEKEAWRTLFDYYVFSPAERARSHLPEGSHGALADLDDDTARRLRALLRENLNR